MHDTWTGRLSEYLDGDLSETDRKAAEAHLGGCKACRRTLGELAQVRARAMALTDAEPTCDLWDGIAARIHAVPLAGRDRMRRRFAFTAPQLAAAAVALMFLSGGAVWMSRGVSGGVAHTAATPAARPAESAYLAGAAATERIETPYATAIRDLERRLDLGRGHLDAVTVRILEESLTSIDRAIEDARRALLLAPNNPYLSRHLAAEMGQKMDLLRRADLLARSQT